MANTTIIIIIITIILVHVGELVARISGRGSRGITCNFFTLSGYMSCTGGKYDFSCLSITLLILDRNW